MNNEYMLHQLFPEGVYLIPEKELMRENAAQAAPVTRPEGAPAGELAVPQPDTEEKDIRSFYKGENRRKVVVLYENTQELPGEQEEFLGKVLTAVHLTMADIALIRYNSHPEKWEQVPAEKLLVFGCERLAGIPAEKYTPVRKDDRIVLRAESLARIMGNKQQKALLWQSLREMFDV